MARFVSARDRLALAPEVAKEVACGGAPGLSGSSIHETKIRRPLEFRGDFLGDLRAYDGLCQSAFCDNPESRNLVILVAR